MPCGNRGGITLQKVSLCSEYALARLVVQLLHVAVITDHRLFSVEEGSVTERLFSLNTSARSALFHV